VTRILPSGRCRYLAEGARERLYGFNQRRAYLCEPDTQIVEIVAVVAENVFANFVNIVAQTEIDFPVVRAAEAA
jgi:hypothetical protein